MDRLLPLVWLLLLLPRLGSATAVPFDGRLTFQIGGLPVLQTDTRSGSADMTRAAFGVSRLTLAASGIGGGPAFTVVPPSYEAAPLSGVQITATNEAGSFTRTSAMAHLGGVMPLHGFARACLFAACDALPLANVVLPLGVVGAGGTTTATAAVNVTVRGAPWTTGRAVVHVTTESGPGSVTRRGSAHTTASGAIELNVVTPVFISTNLPQLSNTWTFVQMLLHLDAEPDCSDGEDRDGDGLADFPEDPGCSSADDSTEREPSLACDDGTDDDGDGAADTSDPGCTGPTDESERQLGLVCDDGIDQDGDELADHPLDPGCTGPTDFAETGPGFVCDNGEDDDGDGLIDLLDPGCTHLVDSDEREPVVDPECNDGLDTDRDGVADFPFDPGCDSPTDPSERGAPVCDDGIDQDGDGRTDSPADGGCVGSADSSERGVGMACDDGLDQDASGAADFPADPGCESSADTTEGEFVACANGLDDDDDGAIDGADGGCASSADDAEEHVFGPTLDFQNFLLDASTTLAAESVRVASHSLLYILPGGAVGHRVVADGGSHVSLDGGSIGGELRVRSTAAITAGSVGGLIRTVVGGRVEVYGGTLGGALEAGGSSQISLYVIETGGRPLGPVPEVAGEISGTLRDGTPFTVSFLRAGAARIELVPEPDALALAIVALAALARVRRSASRAS